MNFNFLWKILLITFLFRFQIFGQSGGGEIIPDVSKFKPVDMTDMVNLFTGDFSYSIPLFYGAQIKRTLSAQINSHFLSHHFENNYELSYAKIKKHQHFIAGVFTKTEVN